MSEVVKRVAQSEFLLAVNRILVVIVSALGFPLLTWTVASVVNLQTQIAIITVVQAQLVEKDRLQDQALKDAAGRRETDVAVTQQLRNDVGRILEKLDGMTQSQRRVEQLLDRDRAPR